MERAETAHHEAGHAVAAIALRVAIERVTIVPGDGFLGEVTMAPPSASRWQLERRAQERALVCLAGPVVAARFRKRRKWPGGHEHDLKAAHAWLSSEAGDDGEVRAWVQLVAERARLFVASELQWSRIGVVAAALLERPTLSGRAVRRSSRACADALGRRHGQTVLRDERRARQPGLGWHLAILAY